MEQLSHGEGSVTSSCLTLNSQRATVAKPRLKIARSMAVPNPKAGGTERAPVSRDATPVAASATTKGNETTRNDFTTALLPVSPRPGLFLHDQTPTTAKTIT